MSSGPIKPSGSCIDHDGKEHRVCEAWFCGNIGLVCHSCKCDDGNISYTEQSCALLTKEPGEWDRFNPYFLG
ncbi:hypothetical protein DPMN_014377 [Dreissena polymorpha]|uniref:Uncharacterized protein n=1 Tax=Dreissena polymorpha TaxID=45954 RepID=A0A9D4N922_DREPO|nr:hypothetical protein DPMN_014377 [Dreissena polymorpha]